jgi:hypothetical protein
LPVTGPDASVFVVRLCACAAKAAPEMAAAVKATFNSKFRIAFPFTLIQIENAIQSLFVPMIDLAQS